MSLKEDLVLKCKGEVEDSEEALTLASQDASIFSVRPKVVVHPKDNADVQAVVRLAHEARTRGEDVSVTARAAGTDMSGGPLSESIILSFTKHLNQIRSITPSEKGGTAVVEPGVYYRDFEPVAAAKGLLLPSFTASKDLCALGGMIANNSGGELNLNYGKTERYVRSLKTILSDGSEATFEALNEEALAKKKTEQTLEGDIYRKMHALVVENLKEIEEARPNVSKNSAGYYLWNIYDKEKKTFDLSKIIVGSQGTLGIVTEATLDLVTPKPRKALLVIFLRSFDKLPEIVRRVLAEHPHAFESYDDQTMKLAFRFLPEIAKHLGSKMIPLAFSFFPELLMTLKGGLPKLVLLAEFSGSTEKEALDAAHRAKESLKGLPAVTSIASENGAKKYWTIRHESFALLRKHVRGLKTAPFIDDFVVRPDDLPEFFPKLETILGKYKLVYTIAGHIGDGNFHIIPLMDLSRPETGKIISDLSKQVYELVMSYKGSITGEHNDGMVRTPYLPMMYSDRIIKLFEETKRIFDPLNVLNPGKKVNGTMKYALDHIKK